MTEHSPALQTIRMQGTFTVRNTKEEQNVLHLLAKVCSAARSKMKKQEHTDYELKLQDIFIPLYVYVKKRARN